MTTPTPYADGAAAILARGWSPIPVHPGAKRPARNGLHGYGGRMLDTAEIAEIAEQLPAANVAARYPDGVVGIDVDALGQHKDGSARRGADTLAKLTEKYGALPPTYRVTSAPEHPTHGTHLYRVPLGTTFTNRAGPDIDVIAHVLRYSLVYPSVHPSGRTYVTVSKEGDLLTELPRPQDLPALPNSWLAHLRKEARNEENPTWLMDLPEGEPTGELRSALDDFLSVTHAAETTGEAPSHSAMLDWTRALADARGYGDTGVAEAAHAAEDAWTSAGGDLSAYHRALSGAKSYPLAVGELGPRPSARKRFRRKGATPTPPPTTPPDKDGGGDSGGAPKIASVISSAYDIAKTDEGRAIAIPYHGPIALTIPDLLDEVLVGAYDRGEALPKRETITAVRDALTAKARKKQAITVWLRAGVRDGAVYLDLGTEDERIVEVTRDGWEVMEDNTSAPPFRRTTATKALPTPVQVEDPEAVWHEFADVLNISPTSEQFVRLRGWLSAALLADIPRPILWITGTQGSGKTTAARMALSVIEPVDALGPQIGKNEKDTHVSAISRYIPSFDNISTISESVSDWLCRMTTGVTVDARVLYTDDGLHTGFLRRASVATSITLPYGLKDDATERIVHVEFEAIDSASRRAEAELWGTYRALHPRLLGAVLTDVSAILRHRDTVRRPGRGWPRMADYARALAALDEARGTSLFDVYASHVDDLMRSRAEDDPVVVAVSSFLAVGRTWEGGPGDLLLALDQYADAAGKAWPTTPRGLSDILQRHAKQLEAVGIEVTRHRSKTKRTIRLVRRSVE